MKLKSVGNPRRFEWPVGTTLFGPRRVTGVDRVFSTHRRFSTVALVAALMLVGACAMTTATVTPELVTKPTKVDDTVVGGDITIIDDDLSVTDRTEERRVGKECRTRSSTEH
mgnify:CR=1 FL=1